jgi:hypothetical protein
MHIDGRETVTCRFRQLPLMHGEYRISTWIGTRGELSDYVEHAAELTVLPADVFGTGRAPARNGGDLVCAHDWLIGTA